MPCAVSRGAGPARHLLAVLDSLAAKGTLIDPAIVGAGERHAVMFQLQHRRHRLPAHILDGVLVAEPVRALHRVVHMKTPVVAVAHVSQRGRHATLRRHGMTASRKHLRHAGRRQPRRCHSQRRSQPGATGTDDHHVVAVVNDVVRPGHCRVPPRIVGVNDLRSGPRPRGGSRPSRSRRTQDRGSRSRCRRSHPYGPPGARRRTPHASRQDSSAT